MQHGIAREVLADRADARDGDEAHPRGLGAIVLLDVVVARSLLDGPPGVARPAILVPGATSLAIFGIYMLPRAQHVRALIFVS